MAPCGKPEWRSRASAYAASIRTSATTARSAGRKSTSSVPRSSAARKEGLPAEGPHPADTIFLKVFGEHREYDAVVTMYHDQGQIAIKLMGFWRGVTVQGGLPIPITTPAHGTAFNIAGQGTAVVGPMRQAFELACRMGLSRRLAAGSRR